MSIYSLSSKLENKYILRKVATQGRNTFKQDILSDPSYIRLQQLKNDGESSASFIASRTNALKNEYSKKIYEEGNVIRSNTVYDQFLVATYKAIADYASSSPLLNAIYEPLFYLKDNSQYLSISEILKACGFIVDKVKTVREDNFNKLISQVDKSIPIHRRPDIANKAHALSRIRHGLTRLLDVCVDKIETIAKYSSMIDGFTEVFGDSPFEHLEDVEVPDADRIEVGRKPLTETQLRKLVYVYGTELGIDGLDDLRLVLEDAQLKEHITTYMNSKERGHEGGITAPELKEEIVKLLEAKHNKTHTNENALEVSGPVGHVEPSINLSEEGKNLLSLLLRFRANNPPLFQMRLKQLEDIVTGVMQPFNMFAGVPQSELKNILDRVR